ncbi:MAG: metallophosphoesterase [Candidatus Riflebacteria bacterium]|nr:metallophosphoesterase [Candidatus Riflebacteria bacterium]
MSRARLSIVVVADSHLGFDCSLRPRIDRRRRGEDFFWNFASVLSYAAANADLLVHGGDLMFRSKVDPRLVKRGYDLLLASARKGLPIVVVPGNHERSRLPSAHLLEHPNIHLLDRPRTVTLSLRSLSVAIAGFPCQRSNVRHLFQSLLEQTGWWSRPEEIKLLAMHQAVEGAKVGAHNYTFRGGPDVIPMASIPWDATAVLCGHIHRRQVLWRRDDGSGRSVPIIYPGSIERTSFAERLEAKGFFEIALGTDQTGEWRAIPHAVSLPSRPMVDVPIPASGPVDEILTSLAERIAALPADAIVRLSCVGEPSPDLRRSLTAVKIREILPSSMNFEFGSAFFRRRSDDAAG